MQEFDILIPISNKLDITRQNNLDYITYRYKKLLPSINIFIGKDDSNQQFFCKSRAVNNAAKKATKDIFMIADIDILCDIEAIKHSVNILNQYSFIIPFNKIYSLPKDFSLKLVKNQEDINTINIIAPEYAAPPILGGIQIVSRDNFNAVNGYDERFVGWGGEDTSFIKSIQCLFGEGLFYENEAYHLWHLKQSSRINYERINKNENKQLRNKYWNNVNNKEKMLSLIKERDIKSYNILDFFAPEKHYFDHLYNLWSKLPNMYKGTFFISSSIEESMEDYVKSFNLNYELVEGQLVKTDNNLIVAGLNSFNFDAAHIILVNHGAGQSYTNNKGVISRSYAGGQGRNIVSMFIQPNDYAASLDKKINPLATQAVVGCTKLDKWHQKTLNGDIKTKEEVPVIAISFHFDCRVCSETRSSWQYYQMALSMLAHKNMTGEWKILGHGHPRIIDDLIPFYEEYNIEVVRNFNEIMERADIYIMDHMSTLYEFASTGRPVVVLNAPWYRKNVEHGLRYWECADVGINVDHPNSLETAIKYALKDPLQQKMKRERALTKVYKYRDGMATERAINSIINFLNQPIVKNKKNQKKINNQVLKDKIRNDLWYRRR